MQKQKYFFRRIQLLCHFSHTRILHSGEATDVGTKFIRRPSMFSSFVEGIAAARASSGRGRMWSAHRQSLESPNIEKCKRMRAERRGPERRLTLSIKFLGVVSKIHSTNLMFSQRCLWQSDPHDRKQMCFPSSQQHHRSGLPLHSSENRFMSPLPCLSPYRGPMSRTCHLTTPIGFGILITTSLSRSLTGQSCSRCLNKQGTLATESFTLSPRHSAQSRSRRLSSFRW